MSKKVLNNVLWRKVLLFRFTRVSGGLNTVPFEAPPVVCYHVDTAPALIPFFHGFNVLVESFSLFFTNSTKIIWTIVYMASKTMNFNTHVTP